MKVIGVDPAPAKKSTVFDGTAFLKPMRADELSAYLAKQRADADALLVCWDSPLTGPAVIASPSARRGDLSQRPIERFFTRARKGEHGRRFRAPAGISVRPYGGCPHWTISRALLGLPRVGPWDADWSTLPFSLWTEPRAPDGGGHFVVEVHPALAMWLWCDRGSSSDYWPYKGKKNRETFATLRDRVLEVLGCSSLGELVRSVDQPQSDDQLDALVAYCLGRLWLDAPDKITLLGSLEKGTFLLPHVHDLVESFTTFSDSGAQGSSDREESLPSESGRSRTKSHRRPASECAQCGRPIEDAGGRRVVSALRSGASIHLRSIDSSLIKIPFFPAHVERLQERFAQVAIVMTGPGWADAAVARARAQAQQGHCPWLCQRCSGLLCCKCQGPLLAIPGTTFLHDDGRETYFALLPIGRPRCVTRGCSESVEAADTLEEE